MASVVGLDPAVVRIALAGFVLGGSLGHDLVVQLTVRLRPDLNLVEPIGRKLASVVVRSVRERELWERRI